MNLSMLKLRITMLCIFLQFGMCLSGPCECECLEKTMVCKDRKMPKHLPLKISELFIKHFDLDILIKNHPQNASLIQKLDIEADKGTSIASATFEHFSNLTYLGLHGKQLRTIDKDAFEGLARLLTLNLSSNPLLTINYISRALNAENRNVLTSLISLSVAKVKTSVGESVMLNEYFFRSIASGRKLKYLDISGLNIYKLNFSHLEHICNSVEFLNVRNSVIGHTLDLNKAKACTSLKTLDISEFIIPALRINFSFENINFSCEWLNIFSHTETALINNVNKMYGVRVNRYFLNVSECPLHLRKVSVAGNKIQWINMTVQLHETTRMSLVELIVSNNGLEYLSPSVLNPSQNIRFLDLSNNKLNVMQEKYTNEFERLFWAQINLRFLNLSRNDLIKIPMQAFSTNILLKSLDVSYNKLSTIDFSLKQLVNIERLIVSHNKIYYIEQDIRVKLQLLWSKLSNDNTHGNGRFHVYLEGNQFQCTCDNTHVRFIEWLHSTQVINENERLTCILQEDLLDVRGTALTDTEHFCRMQTVKKLGLILGPLSLAAVILTIIIAILIKKRREKNLVGTYPLPHLAFLSHCSEDLDLVINKIYPELCEHLSEMTHSNESLVCIGDKHFRPGFPLHDEVMHCVENSSVFVAIISRNYCQKTWCNLEIGEAYDQRKPIIMIMVEYVKKELMDDFLQKIFDRYAHATWKPDDNGGHIEPEWKIFCKSIIQLAGKSSAVVKNVRGSADTAF